MAKDIIEALNSLLTPEERALPLDKALTSNSKARELLAKGVEFYGYYIGEKLIEPEAPPAAPPSPSPSPTPAPPSVITAPPSPVPAVVAPPAPASSVSPSSPAFDLAALERMFDSKLAAQTSTLEKKFVSSADLPKLKGELIGTALMSSHQLVRLETQHKQLFNEDLDLDALNKYANEHPGKFGTITDAYNDMTRDKRNEAEIARRVAEGIKQKKSGDGVPAQSSSPAMSPAAQVLKKAKDSGNGSGIGAAAERALNKLKEIDASRAGAGAE